MTWLTLPENRQAHLAVELLAKDERHPLQMFLWGPPGTGKTRLTVRWLKRMLKEKPDARVLRVTAQELSLRLRGVFVPPGQQAPKSRLGSLRRADALVLEDLHRLNPKRVPALARLLDHRHSYRRATLITSREPLRVEPLSLQPLQLRLVGGLVVAIQPMGMPSRQLALEKLAPIARKRLAESTRQWLVRQAGASWRALAAQARLVRARMAPTGPMLEPAAGRMLFADLERPKARPSELIRLVARHFGVTEGALKGKGRQPSLVLARQVAMTILRRHTELSLERVGHHLGGRDPATVRHSLQKIAKSRLPLVTGALRELGQRIDG